MTTNRIPKILSLVLAVVMIVTTALTFVGCKPAQKTYYDNENDKLVFTTQEVDKVFNPFFSTSATDSSVVGMTQIGMIANDEKGNPVYGDDEAVVAKDLEIITEGTYDVDQTTTYYFVLKNNVKFSNGSALTIKDVLFNLYLYLDPAYTGSSTIYSTDIVGLKEYRTQAATEEEQDAFETKYRIAARARVDALIEAATAVLEDHARRIRGRDLMKSYLQSGMVRCFRSLCKRSTDFEKTQELFHARNLKTTTATLRDSYEEQIFVDKEGNEYRNLFTTDVEMFLFNEGFISWNKDEGQLHSSLVSDSDLATLKEWSEETAINTV